LRIYLFNKIAVSSDDSLNLDLEAVAELHHGVPVEGHSHLLDLLDQILLLGVAMTFDSVTSHAK
jgi:hypothetical protein